MRAAVCVAGFGRSGRRGVGRDLILAIGMSTVLLLVAASSSHAHSAYVSNYLSNDVSVVDTATNTVVGGPITVGINPDAVAISPDGTRAYVASDVATGTVSVIDTQTNEVVGLPIDAEDRPKALAITPDGARLYVTNVDSDSVLAIDTATRQPIGPPIAVGPYPAGIAITPDGSRAFVTNRNDGTVSVIDIQANAVVGPSIAVGGAPRGIAVTPDGSRAYVVDSSNGELVVVDVDQQEPVGAPIPVGDRPFHLAIHPTAARLYVGNMSGSDNTVSVVDTATNLPIATVSDPQLAQPFDLAVAPDGSRAYITNFAGAGNSVSVLGTGSNELIGPPIPVGTGPAGIAIVPNQGPAASLSAPADADAGDVVGFDALGSSDPDGSVERYDWSFGDGTTLPDGGPIPTHVFGSGGVHTVTVRVTDDEGCSDELVFTGQTASCNGGPQAVETADIAVAANRPARLEVGRATVRRAGGAPRLIVSGRLARAAAGERAIVRVRMLGRELRLRPPVRANGRFAANRALRGALRRARAGRAVVGFRGNLVLRPARQAVRVAPRPAALRFARNLPRLAAGRNVVALAGRARNAAGGLVRIRVEFNRASGAGAVLRSRARVNPRGVFRQRMRVPAVVRAQGAWVSVAHAGRGPVHGQAIGSPVRD